MTVLSAQEIEDYGTDLINPFKSANLTSQGYDIEVAKVERLEGYGRLLVEGKTLPHYREASLVHLAPRYALKPGQYIVTFKEEVNLPHDICAFLWSRSTLLRMGASIQTAVWDAGYHGQGSSLLIVSNPDGIILEIGARIGQMVFHRLGQATEQPYDGQYQGGKRG